MTEERFQLDNENLAVYMIDSKGNTATMWVLDVHFIDLSTDDFEKLRRKVLETVAKSKVRIEYCTDGEVTGYYNMASLQEAVDKIIDLKHEGWHIACISESFSYLTKKVLDIRFWPGSPKP